MGRVVTLLTDFGTRDHYVASMKGVILSIAPGATVVDITHGVPKWDVRAGAYLLRCAYKYFPRGTVHVAVVDPGVGTGRRALAVETRDYYFVGPDNGLLMPAALEDGVVRVVSIENPRYMRPAVSHTFHGRDVFAPAAAHLALGVDIRELGPEVTDYAVPGFARPRVGEAEVSGEVVYVDDFGNAATNVTLDDLGAAGLGYGDSVEVETPRGTFAVRLVRTFGEVGEGEPLLLVNSEGFLELAVNRGRGSDYFGVSPGTPIRVRRR